MNHTEERKVKQSFAAASDENLSRDLRLAIKIINAEYQQIDWEDQSFLNRVLNKVLKNLEASGGIQSNG